MKFEHSTSLKNTRKAVESAKVNAADAREALARAASAFFRHPSKRLTMIGVGGCGGRTTVAFIVRHILQSAGIKSGLITPVRQEADGRILPVTFSTDETQLHSMLARMVHTDCSVCVMETDSEVLAKRRSVGVDFDIAIFSNFQFEPDLANPETSQRRLPDQYRGFLAKTGTAVINIDGPSGDQTEAAEQYELILSYGMGEAAKIRAKIIALRSHCTQMEVDTPEGSFLCKMPLIGRQNVYNVLAAVGACVRLEVPCDVIQHALESMPQVQGRMERLQWNQSFQFVIDHSSKPGTLRRTLRLLREITPGRILLGIGCPDQTDLTHREAIGGIAAEHADLTMITADNPRMESPVRIASQIIRGFARAGKSNFRVEIDRRLAVHGLVEMARPGDVILMAGKGHETHQEIDDAMVPMDDRESAHEMADWITSLKCN